tara:strand:- start:1260 stop:2234 length:975 start_codon:yes stop_codon:yes gene_type:complete
MKDKILITGATGFIGSHLAEACIKKGYRIVAFDRYNLNNSWGWLENSKYIEDIEFILGDIRDYDSVYKALDGCSAVFHLAALVGIPYSYISPLAYLRTNTEGTYNVLEASKNLDLDQILITSTSETYGSAQHVPINEDHPLVGQSPYSASKIAADQFALSYYKSFDSPVKIVRPFNTYGPRQSARAIIPSIMSQIANDSEIKIGNTSPTRDLTFVKDTANGFIEIFNSNKLFGEVCNIGMNKEISINDLAKLIIEISGKQIKITSSSDRVRPKESEVDRLVCDNSKLLKHTSWKPEYDLKNGLKIVYDWVIKNKSYFKSEIYNI